MDCPPPPPAPQAAPVSDRAGHGRRRPHRTNEQDGPPGWWSPDADDLHLAIDVGAGVTPVLIGVVAHA